LQIECASCEDRRMNAYSKDLRIKALGAVDRGMPRKEAASTFGISLATLKRWLKQLGQERHADLLDHCGGDGPFHEHRGPV
jgi:transposase